MKATSGLATALILTLMMSSGSSSATHDAAGDACKKRHTRRLVTDFVRAHNRGRFSTLDRLFAKEPKFYRYRMSPEREGSAAEDRSILIDYFKKRHSHGDHMKIIEVNVSDERSPDGTWGFNWTIERSSEDNKAYSNGTFHGKGGALCKIIQWNGGWNP